MLRTGLARGPRRRPEGVALAWGLAASAGIHAALAAVLTLAHVAIPQGRAAAARPLAVELLPPLPDPPPVVEVPRARPPVPRPVAPETPAVAPPSTDAPRFIPHDLPPRLLNGTEIRRALEDGVPADLPAEAVRSRVTLWLFVDEAGVVRKLRIQGPSGFPVLDALASRVAEGMAYRPALHQGRRVAVWVSQPIRFQPDSLRRVPSTPGG